MTEGQTKILNIYEENVIIVKQQLKKNRENKTKAADSDGYCCTAFSFSSES